MDKSWMSKDRLTREYNNGVETLISIEKDEDSFLRCPCKNCGNLFELKKREVRSYLVHHGFCGKDGYAGLSDKMIELGGTRL